MVDVAQHIRIFEASPTDDFVTKRKAAIKEISSKLIASRNFRDLLEMANAVVIAARFDKDLALELANEATAAIKKQSQAFVQEGRALELSTCILLAAITALESRAKTKVLNARDFLSVGIWLGMSMQPESENLRIEALRAELLDVARQYALKAAKDERARSEIGEIPDLTEDKGNLATVLSSLKETVQTLSTNAAIDHEEIDFLWWSISSWSTSLKRQYSEAEPYVAALALGIDGARRLRRMPLEYHKELILRRLPDADPIEMEALAKVLGEDRQSLIDSIPGHSVAKSNPEVFPLAFTILTGESPPNGPRQALEVSDWTKRAMLECTALGVINRQGV